MNPSKPSALVDLWSDQARHPQFIDLPVVADAFRKYQCYTVLSLGELNSAVSEETIAMLSPAELAQIKYWKPTTIGQILFNSWD